MLYDVKKDTKWTSRKGDGKIVRVREVSGNSVYFVRIDQGEHSHPEKLSLREFTTKYRPYS
jgi:hypothetical protein